MVHILTEVWSIQSNVYQVSAKHRKTAAVTVLTKQIVFSDRNLHFSNYSDHSENTRQVQ
jgi:hypothetical protein